MLKHTIPAALAEHGPLSNAGLRLVLPGASRSGIHLVIQTLKDARKIHITGYVLSDGRVGGAHAPVYALGDLPDVAKPETRKDKQEARKAEPIKPPARRGGRRLKVKPLVPPKAHEPMRINRVHEAGIWSGLMA